LRDTVGIAALNMCMSCTKFIEKYAKYFITIYIIQYEFGD